MPTETYLTRHDVARKWGVTLRTVDRLRFEGVLAWLDISAGRSARPQVRFRLCDVMAVEEQMRKCADDNHIEE